MKEPRIFQTLTSLYLASASPRRRAFFRELGVPVSALAPPPGAEPAPRPGEGASDYALRGARAKAHSVLDRLPEPGGFLPPRRKDCTCGQKPVSEALIIAADTVVFLEGRIFGKPGDAAEALDMLRALAGKEHNVVTGCALLQVFGAEDQEGAGAFAVGRKDASPPLRAVEAAAFSVSSRVRMWRAPDKLLTAYAAGGEPLDKAGAYAVQGAGACLVESIEGSWSNVVGLPLAELLQELLRLKALRPAGA